VVPGFAAYAIASPNPPTLVGSSAAGTSGAAAPPCGAAACRTRRLFWTWVTPDTCSARLSARRRALRLSTVPLSVTSPPLTLTSISEAST
jgi:hypothetical protein